MLCIDSTMGNNLNRYLVAVAVILIGLLIAKCGSWWWTQREWFKLQNKQLATIEQLGQFPPVGTDQNRWESELITLYNVWANVTYRPDYSGLSNAQMHSLHLKLEKIIAETTRENAIESIDSIFNLMLQNSPREEFITRHRDIFEKYRK